jgi:hypothetical protein
VTYSPYHEIYIRDSSRDGRLVYLDTVVDDAEAVVTVCQLLSNFEDLAYCLLECWFA